jgi:glycosyltransferase involved in cell wall biosynthesis
VDRYAAELRDLVARTAGVELHERYVSDEEFDLWIRAADAVVVAYRTAASSGVVERAHLLGTTVITSGAGGISEQERPGDLHFDTDAELVDVIRALVGDTR